MRLGGIYQADVCISFDAFCALCQSKILWSVMWEGGGGAGLFFLEMGSVDQTSFTLFLFGLLFLVGRTGWVMIFCGGGGGVGGRPPFLVTGVPSGIRWRG